MKSLIIVIAVIALILGSLFLKIDSDDKITLLQQAYCEKQKQVRYDIWLVGKLQDNCIDYQEITDIYTGDTRLPNWTYEQQTYLSNICH